MRPSHEGQGVHPCRDPRKGLAMNLLDDCEKIGTTVSVFDGIAPYLQSLGKDVPEFDREKAKRLIAGAARADTPSQASHHLYEPTEVLGVEGAAFRVEQLDRVALDYTVTFRLVPIPDRCPCVATTPTGWS